MYNDPNLLHTPINTIERHINRTISKLNHRSRPGLWYQNVTQDYPFERDSNCLMHVLYNLYGQDSIFHFLNLFLIIFLVLDSLIEVLFK